MKCVICKSNLMEDEVIYEINPLSFRKAIMCLWCLIFAYESLDYDRKCEYHEKISK